MQYKHTSISAQSIVHQQYKHTSTINCVQAAQGPSSKICRSPGRSRTPDIQTCVQMVNLPVWNDHAVTFHITYICTDLLSALSNCQAVKVSMWKTDSIHWVCQFVEWFVDSDDGMMPIWWSWHYGADMMMLIWCRVSNSFPSTAADSMGTHLATLPRWDSVTTKPVWLLCFLFLVMNKYKHLNK